jgi:DNA polymerase
MHVDGVVQGNLNYHGAGTGRWAGRGFQYHNLPRAKLDNAEVMVEAMILAFIQRQFIEDPVGTAKALIRPMIKAPDGFSIIASDYLSIENRVLAWLANDEETLEGFRNDFDQYVDMASFLFKVPIDQVDKSQRQLGKALVLGCGYGMSGNRFQVAAQTFGVHVDKVKAKFAVDAYRMKYRLIVKMWYQLA